jgi:hypothetical protein
MGYLSAYNRFVLTVDNDVSEGIDVRGLISWIDNYCAGHPLDRVSSAAYELLQELQRRSGAR